MTTTINELDLIDILIRLHPENAEYTFFSDVSRIFIKIDYFLGHKTSLKKFKRIQVILCSPTKMDLNQKSVIEVDLKSPQILGN